jgi:hypothetical protein
MDTVSKIEVQFLKILPLAVSFEPGQRGTLELDSRVGSVRVNP